MRTYYIRVFSESPFISKRLILRLRECSLDSILFKCLPVKEPLRELLALLGDVHVLLGEVLDLGGVDARLPSILEALLQGVVLVDVLENYAFEEQIIFRGEGP